MLFVRSNGLKKPNSMLSTLMLILSLFLMTDRARAEETVLQRATLPNGVRLLIQTETAPEINQIAISMFVPNYIVGTHEVPVSEMVARGLFYGNRNRTKNGIMTLASRSGRDFEVLTNRRYSAVSLVTTTAQMSEAIHLLSDCLKNVEFTTESLRDTLKTIREQRASAQEDVETMALNIVSQDLGFDSPSLEELGRVTPNEASSFFEQTYYPQNIVISIAGKVNPQQTLQLVTSFFGNYAPRAFHGRRPPTEDSWTLNLNHLKEVRTIPISGNVAYTIIATRCPSSILSNRDYPAFTVLEALLGGGHASRLFRATREKLGIGYRVGSIYRPEQPGPFALVVQWNPDRLRDPKDTPTQAEERIKEVSDTLAKLLNELLDDIVAHPPSKAELERARAFSIGRDLLRHEELRNRAFFPGWYEATGPGLLFDRQFPIQLRLVTAEDVQDVARFLDKRTTLVLIPKRP